MLVLHVFVSSQVVTVTQELIKVAFCAAELDSDVLLKQFQKQHTDIRNSKTCNVLMSSFDPLPLDGNLSFFVEGTRTSQQEEFVNWLSGNKPLFFVHGQHGCGKSVLLAKLVETCQNEGLSVAHYFFQHNDAADLAVAIQGLAYQLTKQLPDLEDMLAAKMQCLHSWLDTPARLFEELIVGPLRTFFSSPRAMQVVLLLDALDECNEEHKLLEIIGSHLSGARALPSGVRVVVSSCSPLSPSLPSFLCQVCPLGAAGDKANEGDVRLALKSWFQDDICGLRKAFQDWKMQDAEAEAACCQLAEDIQIIGKSVFIYAKVACGVVKASAASCQDLAELKSLVRTFPSDLPELLLGYIRRVFQAMQEDKDKGIRTSCERLLQCVIAVGVTTSSI